MVVVIDITTERDDYIRQTITRSYGLSYGLSKHHWGRTTKFMNVYECLSPKEHSNPSSSNQKSIEEEEHPNSRDLFQAKLELEYQLEFLNKQKSELSLEGNSCAQQLILLLDEAHSITANAFYKSDYERLINVNVSINIDKQALLKGIINQITIFLENKGRKTGNYLLTDIQKIQRWVTD